MSKTVLLGYAWGLGLVLVSATPALLDPRDDSYPVSTYPMFSSHRGQPDIHRMEGVTRLGERRPLAPSLVANAETLQAAAVIRRAANGGRRARRDLCRSVAARVAEQQRLADLIRIEMRVVRYDPITYFTVGKVPLSAKRLASCKVPR